MDYDKIKRIFIQIKETGDWNKIIENLSFEERKSFIEAFYNDEKEAIAVTKSLESEDNIDFNKNFYTHIFTTTEAKEILKDNTSADLNFAAIKYFSNDQEKLACIQNPDLELEDYHIALIIESFSTDESKIKGIEIAESKLDYYYIEEIIKQLTTDEAKQKALITVGPKLELDDFSSLVSNFDEKDFSKLFLTLSEELQIEAIKNGLYTITAFSPQHIKENSVLTGAAYNMAKTPEEKKELLKCTVLPAEIIKEAIEMGECLIDKDSPQYIWESLKGEEDFLFKDKEEKYKDSVKKLRGKINLQEIYLNSDTFFTQDMLDAYGSDFVVKMYKYAYLLNKDKEATGQKVNKEEKIDFKFLKDKEAEIKYIYEALTKKTLKEDFTNMDMLFFLSLTTNFQRYEPVFLDYFTEIAKCSSKEEVDSKKEKLKRLMEIKEDLSKEIKTVEDIDNIDTVIQSKHEEEIESIENIEELRNLTYLMLCNETSENIRDLSSNKIKSEKLLELRKGLKEEDAKSLAGKYEVLLTYIEYISRCQNIEELRENARQINAMQEEMKDIWEVTKGFTSKIKGLYSMELNQELTKVSELGEPEATKTASDIVIDGEKLEGKEVPYYELGGEDQENYRFLTHTMNAFGSGGKITDWKNPRTRGKTHLSLCLIDGEIDMQITANNTSNINHVILLFDQVDSITQMGDEDVFSYSSGLEINAKDDKKVFDTTENTLNNTTSYNEYVVYRDDIKPSGIAVKSEPTQAEIDAAAYLGVPLIKLKPTKRKEKSKETEIEEQEIEQRDVKDFKGLIEGLKEDKEQLEAAKKVREQQEMISFNESNIIESNEVQRSL